MLKFVQFCSLHWNLGHRKLPKNAVVSDFNSTLKLMFTLQFFHHSFNRKSSIRVIHFDWSFLGFFAIEPCYSHDSKTCIYGCFVFIVMLISFLTKSSSSSNKSSTRLCFHWSFPPKSFWFSFLDQSPKSPNLSRGVKSLVSLDNQTESSR